MSRIRRARARGVALLAAAVFLICLGVASASAAAATPGPLAIPQAYLTDFSGIAGDNLGREVAVSGDTIVVGVPGRDVDGMEGRGAAIVYVDDGGGWAHQATLTASDGLAGDAFGHSVAISGDTIVVGAVGDDFGATVDKGSAYIFVRSGPVWTQQAKLTMGAVGGAGECFGQSVGIDGETVVVGSPYLGAEYPDEGAIWVFRRTGTAWPEIKRLFSPNGYRHTAHLGWSVGISGNIVVGGAPTDGIGLVFETGTAWTFEEHADHTWGCSGIGQMWDWENQAWAGYSVAISGTTVVVGVLQKDIGGNVNQGEAWVYLRTPGAPEPWLRQAKIVADDGAAGDVFGRAVAVSGDTLLIGASGDDPGGNDAQGSAYLFTRTGGVWSQRQHIVAFDGAMSDLFGSAVAIANDIAVVGAYGHDTDGHFDQGQAYAYGLDRLAPVTTPIPDPAPNSAGWNRSPVAVTLAGADALSGVAKTWYRFGTSGEFVAYDPSDKPRISAAGATTIEFYSEDVTGNVEAAQSLEVRIDMTPPVTTIGGVPDGWVPGPVAAVLTPSDDFSGTSGGDARTEYWTIADGWTTGTDVPVSAEGTTTILYRSRDAAGNVEEPHVAKVMIDGVAPTTRAWPAAVTRGRKVRLHYQVNDALPSCDGALVTLKVFKRTKLVKQLALPDVRPCNVQLTHVWRCTLARGRYTVKVFATDIAGNVQATVGGATLTVR